VVSGQGPLGDSEHAEFLSVYVSFRQLPNRASKLARAKPPAFLFPICGERQVFQSSPRAGPATKLFCGRFCDPLTLEGRGAGIRPVAGRYLGRKIVRYESLLVAGAVE
jgi:hypothetical protein